MKRRILYRAQALALGAMLLFSQAAALLPQTGATITAATAGALGVMVITETGCGKGDALTNAQYVLDGLNGVQALLAQVSPQAEADLKLALPIAQKIKDAIAASNSASAVALIADLIPTFEKIVGQDIDGIDPNLRAEIILGLTLANIGLHFLVSNVISQPELAATRSGMINSKRVVLEVFNSKPAWRKK